MSDKGDMDVKPSDVSVPSYSPMHAAHNAHDKARQERGFAKGHDTARPGAAAPNLDNTKHEKMGDCGPGGY